MKFLDDFPARTHNGLRFVPEKTGWANFLLQFGRTRIGKGVGLRIFFKERWRNHVHTLVSALRRQNCGNQQLKRILVLQRAGGRGIRRI